MTIPLAPTREPLRRDPRGFQIEDDEAAEAMLVGLEAFALIHAEIVLKRLSRHEAHAANTDDQLALRALGHLAGQLGMSRLSWLTGVDEAGRRRRDRSSNPMAAAAGERWRALLDRLLVWDLHNVDAPPQLRRPAPLPAAVSLALRELWASALYFHRRANNAGAAGPGRKRKLTRTTRDGGSH